MTKDDTYSMSELLALTKLRGYWGILTESQQEQLEMDFDAYAQAHTDAARADTLKLLEATVGPNDDDLITKEPGDFSYELVIIRRGDGSLLYRDRTSDQDLTRAEVEALLAREEKKECP